MKRYTCGKCKKPFADRFRLTKHLGTCGRVPPKEATPACPECKKRFKGSSALGAHRSKAHGVRGNSRWARKSRVLRAQAKGVVVPAGRREETVFAKNDQTKTAYASVSRRPEMVFGVGGHVQSQKVSNGAVAEVLEKARWHRNEARTHMEKADKLTTIAKDLEAAF